MPHLQRASLTVPEIAENDVVEQDFCFQHLLDYHNQFPVLYPDSPPLPNELSVVDIIKEANNVYIYYKVQILQLYHFIILCDCVLRWPIRSETIVPLMEFRFTDRLKYL